MIAMTYTSLPIEVRAKFNEFPPDVGRRLGRVRTLILDVARETAGVGRLTETLRWGEPAYLTEATGSGSTIRLGWPKAGPERAALYFDCKTTLVPTFREIFPHAFEYGGNRAILLNTDGPIDEGILSACIGMALTYHLAKGRSRRSGRAWCTFNLPGSPNPPSAEN